MSNNLDYKHLLMLESWSCKDAALIICGFEPDNYRHIRFSPKQINSNTNPELIPAYKLYKVFESVNQNKSYNNRLNHPTSYINECRKKEWSVPDELLIYVQEKQPSENTTQNDIKIKDSILKILAAVVMLYVSEKKSPDLGTLDKVNVSRLTEKLLQFLQNHNINIHGLGKSSLNEKIAQAIRSFNSSRG